MNNKKAAIIFFMPNMEDPITIEQQLKGLFGTKAVKKGLIFFLLFWGFALSACNLSTATMTSIAYDQISIGASVTEVENQVGSPYRITSEGELKKYFYIERIQIGPSSCAHNNYILIVKDGRVVDKQKE